MISSAATPVIWDAFSGGYSSTAFCSSSKPTVRRSMNSLSSSPSLRITFIMALIRAMLVPGIWLSQTEARLTSSILRGSATIIFAPFLAALIIFRLTTG